MIDMIESIGRGDTTSTVTMTELMIVMIWMQRRTRHIKGSLGIWRYVKGRWAWTFCISHDWIRTLGSQ